MKPFHSGGSTSSNTGDLGEKVLALLRYYGRGKRTAFIQQIARRVAVTDDFNDTDAWGTWWQIYHRLCDFGLVTQTGRGTEMSWQWSGDRVSILPSGEALFPSSSLNIDGFETLHSKFSFTEEAVYRLDLEGPEDFVIRYLASNQADRVLEVIRDSNLPIETSTNTSILNYLPSAQDVFGRSSMPTASLPEDSELEQRDCGSSQWAEYRESAIKSSFLIRMARSDRPGYRYWLVDNPEFRIYEMVNSDWLPILLWWISERQWPLIFEQSKKHLLVPVGFYFSAPVLLRSALILRAMRWPSTVSINSRKSFKFVGIPISDVRILERLYAPALKVKYVK